MILCLNLQYVETDLQKLQMKLKTEPRQAHEAMEAEYAAAARAKPVRRPPDLDTSGKPSRPALITPTVWIYEDHVRDKVMSVGAK